MLEADKTLSAADAAPGKWEQCLSLYKSSDFMVSILRWSSVGNAHGGRFFFTHSAKFIRFELWSYS